MERSCANEKHVKTAASTRRAPPHFHVYNVLSLPAATLVLSFSQWTLPAAWNLTDHVQTPSRRVDSGGGCKQTLTGPGKRPEKMLWKGKVFQSHGEALFTGAFALLWKGTPGSVSISVTGHTWEREHFCKMGTPGCSCICSVQFCPCLNHGCRGNYPHNLSTASVAEGSGRATFCAR